MRLSSSCTSDVTIASTSRFKRLLASWPHSHPSIAVSTADSATYAYGVCATWPDAAAKASERAPVDRYSTAASIVSVDDVGDDGSNDNGNSADDEIKTNIAVCSRWGFVQNAIQSFVFWGARSDTYIRANSVFAGLSSITHCCHGFCTFIDINVARFAFETGSVAVAWNITIDFATHSADTNLIRTLTEASFDEKSQK